VFLAAFGLLFAVTRALMGLVPIRRTEAIPSPKAA
jgi:hypothetical protein